MLFASQLVWQTVGEDEESVALLVFYNVVGKTLFLSTVGQWFATNAFARALELLETTVVSLVEFACARAV